MDLALKERVAFIAGSSRGIGKAIARSFLREGARVVISGRGKEYVDQAANEFRDEFGSDSIIGIAGDLTDAEVIQRSLEQVSEKWGRIDIAVANIGSGSAKVGWQSDAAAWSGVFAINFFSATALLKEAIPYLARNGRGSAVIVSSIVGVEATNAPLAYSSAKAALLNYSKNLSRVVSSLGVRVNVVAPGNILFEGGTWETHVKNRPDEVAQYIKSEVPLSRFGTPEEIANFVVFLSSPNAAFATGTCIVIDGGQTRTI